MYVRENLKLLLEVTYVRVCIRIVRNIYTRIISGRCGSWGCKVVCFLPRGSPAQFRIHRAQCTVLHLICIHIRPLTPFLHAVALYVHQCVLAQQLVPTQWFLAVLLTSRLVASRRAASYTDREKRENWLRKPAQTRWQSRSWRNKRFKFRVSDFFDSRFAIPILLVCTENNLPVDYLPRNFQTTNRQEKVKRKPSNGWLYYRLTRN